MGGSNHPPPHPPPQRGREFREKGDIESLTRDYLRRCFAGILHIEAASISDHRSYETLGVDSLVMMQLIRRLEQDLGKLPKTLLFEARTLAALADRLIAEHGSCLDKLLLRSPVDAASPEPPQPQSPPPRLPLHDQPGGRHEPIAIIGLAGRYPDADNLTAFWENLQKGRDGIREVPAERWNWRDWFDPSGERRDRSYSKWGGFLNGVDQFDPLFFGISPREARGMDPQERLFLEIAWAALEDAAYTRQGLATAARVGHGREVGVFVGVMHGNYPLIEAGQWQPGQPLIANSPYWSIANRISHFGDFHGPSLAVDTACSSSLTAIHLACESIRRGECGAALAGGVNLLLHPRQAVILSQMKMLAQGPHCRPFGAGADGLVMGEGVGAVLLRPLRDALRDGDPIHGVIAASSINAGGHAGGYTVPNPDAQAGLIQETLERAGWNPETIGYVEAHGTGTALGDPIEVAALTRVWRQHTAARHGCALGSVKSNIGHLEAAAGIAGLTKTLLQLRHATLVPTLHCEPANPHIEWADSPFFLVRERQPWPSAGTIPRRAALSSFGAGGANAHLLIEEHRVSTTAPAIDRPALIVLSARNEERLREQARQLLEHLEQPPQLGLSDLARTLQVGRETFNERLALPVIHQAELRQQLSRFVAGDQGIWLRGSEAPEAPETAIAPVELAEWRQWALQGEWADLGRLWVNGRAIPWVELETGSRRRIHLPTYPFERQSYWLTAVSAQSPHPNPPPQQGKESVGISFPGGIESPLLDGCLPALHEARFIKRFTGDEWLLREHQVGGVGIWPGVAHLEMARAAAELTLEQPVTGLRQVAWLRPVTVDGRQGRELRLTLKEQDGVLRFKLADATEPAQVYSRGVVTVDPMAALPPHELAAIQQRCPNRLDHERIYALLTAQGVDYGPRLQQLETLWYGLGEVLAQLRPLESVSDGPVSGWHPALLDAALQSLMGIFLASGQPGARLPHAFGALTVHGELSQARFVHVQAPAAEAPCNLWLLDEQGQVVLAIEELVLRAPADSPRPLGEQLGERNNDLQAFLMLEELGRLELLAFFQQAGFWQHSGDICTEAQLRQRLAVSAQHQRLLAALMTILEGAGLLARRDESLVATSAVEDPEWQHRLRDRAQLARQLAEHHPAMTPHLQLLQRCLAEYPALLRGERAATEVFFPDGSLDQVEGIYRGYGLADHFHTVLAGELRAAVAAWIASGEPAPIRILEIGAGTGGTTGHVLQALAGLEKQVELIYTDISPRFTQHGQRRFGHTLPHIRFQTLDIERDPLAQGFIMGDCHLILASNVLHATCDIAVTLGHVKRLLRPGGRLLINEMTASRDFATLTFGLLDGWWRATDGQRRLPHSPLLDVARWQTAFRGAGLTPLAAHGEPGVSASEQYQQSVLVSALPASMAVDKAPAPALEDLIAHTLAPVPLAPIINLSSRPPARERSGERASDSPRPPAEEAQKAGVNDSLLAAIEAVVSEVVAEVFEMSLEQVRSGRVMNFTDFGADSILSAELVAKLNARMGLSLKTTAIFNYPGIRELTGHLYSDFSEQLRERLLAGTAAPSRSAPLPAPAPAVVEISLEALLRQLESGEMDYETALTRFPGELLDRS